MVLSAGIQRYGMDIITVCVLICHTLVGNTLGIIQRGNIVLIVRLAFKLRSQVGMGHTAAVNIIAVAAGNVTKILKIRRRAAKATVVFKGVCLSIGVVGGLILPNLL